MLQKTHTNHHKLLTFIFEVYPKTLMEKRLPLPDGDERLTDTYWRIVRGFENGDMEDIFNYFFPEEELKTYKDSQLLKNIVKFKLNNFGSFHSIPQYEIGKTIIIGEETMFADRALKKLSDCQETVVYEPHYHNGTEKDYETAIEIVTIDEFKIPAFRYIKLEENLVFVKPDKGKRFFKNSYEYDMKSYGKAWM